MRPSDDELRKVKKYQHAIEDGGLDCKTCKEFKPLEEYQLARDFKKMTITIQGECNTCRNVRAKDNYALRLKKQGKKVNAHRLASAKTGKSYDLAMEQKVCDCCGAEIVNRFYWKNDDEFAAFCSAICALTAKVEGRVPMTAKILEADK